MDLDDLDIYEDLDTFQKEEEKKTAELLSLEAKYSDAQKTVEALQVENAELKKQIRRIGINFQNLLDTAKAEIKRKDKQIEQIRKEKDDICFRRKQPRREYTDVASTSQNANVWFRNESVLPAHDFESNAMVLKSKETIEITDIEQPCTTSYITSVRENAQIRDEYKKVEHREERSERKYDFDTKREKYNRSNNQRDLHESRHRAHSNDRDGKVSTTTRDYIRSHDSRTADRSRRDERDIRIRNKHYTTEKEKESYNSKENGRRQHSNDRLSDRSRYHSKEKKIKSENYDSRYDRRSDHNEEKIKSENYDGRHDKRNDHKEQKNKSESYDGRHDKRNDRKKYHEDPNKKSKEINEKACEKVTNMNKNEEAAYTKNSGDRTKSDHMRGKSKKPSESKSENNSNEKYKLNAGSHTETRSNETIEDLAFLDKNLPATKNETNLEKLLAEEKLIKEKLLSLECESTRTKTDKNSNRLMPEDDITMPKKTALLDKLFGSTPTNARDINSNTLSNAIGFIKSNNSSASTSPSTYTDTSESTTVSYINNSKNTEPAEDYLPINGDQNRHYKNDNFVVKNDNTASNGGLTIEAKPQELISSVNSKKQAADESSFTKFGTNVKTSVETVDYAKLATSILSEDEHQTEVEEAVETFSICNAEAGYIEHKTNGNKYKGGIKILENIRLPNIYEIRAHQRRLREAAAAKKAKQALTAKTNDLKQNTSQMVVAVSEQFSKDIEKSPTTAAENNKGVGLQEGCVEIKNKQEEECSLGNSPQINVSVSTEFTNEKSIEDNGTETSNTAVQQSTENVTLSQQNLSSPLAAVEIIETAEKFVSSHSVADDAALGQIKSDAISTNHQNETEKQQNETGKYIRSNIIENTEIQNAAEIEDIQLKQANIHCQSETEETNSSEVNTNANYTLEIVAEKTNIPNETQNGQTSLEFNKKPTASPTPDSRNEENQSEDLRKISATKTAQSSTNQDLPDSKLLTKIIPDGSERKSSSIGSKDIPSLNSSTEAGRTFTNKDMANLHSNSLIKVVSNNNEQKKSIVESKENILKSQGPDQSKVKVSQCSRKADNNALIAYVAEQSEKSCKQNVDSEQESSAEVQKVDGQKVVLSPEVESQESKKLIEPLKIGNEPVIKTEVVLENPESKADVALSEDKSEENNIERLDVASEPKTIEQSGVELTEPKKAVESAVDTSGEPLESAETNIAKSVVNENCITESNEIVITDVTTSIISDAERAIECSTNAAPSNDNNSINLETEPSAIIENGPKPVAIEKPESTLRNNICAENGNVKIAGSNESELHETEDVVPCSINNRDTPTESCLEEKETMSAVQNAPNVEPKIDVESKETKLHTKVECGSKNIESKPRELSNALNISAERNVIVENMKRAEVLWKFKIPKLSAKRKREESVDYTHSEEGNNIGSDAVKREKLCNNAEAPFNPHKKKKSTKLIQKQMPEEKKVLERLFEDQKKSERIIKEIDNWARRKVGEKAEMLETEIEVGTAQAHKKSSSQNETISNINSKDKIPTDTKVLNTHIKEKHDKQKAHEDTNSECSSIDSKCVSEKEQEYKKSPKKQTSPCNKDDKTHKKRQNMQIQERRKSHSNVEHENQTHGSKHRDVKYNVESHKEKSQTNRGNNGKCEQTVLPKAQYGEVQIRNVENGENENNTVKKSPVGGELGDKFKKVSHMTIEHGSCTVKKELHIREPEDQSKKCLNTENITSKSPAEVEIPSKIAKVKSECSNKSPDNSNQKKENERNCSVSMRKSFEKGERETDNDEKRAKSDVDVGKKEMVQKVTETQVSSTEITEVAASAHDSQESCKTETIEYHQRVVATFTQSPKRRRTADAASSDDSEVMSKPRRHKHCKMRIGDSDCDEDAFLTLPPSMPHPSAVNQVDSERINTDILDILQNDRANESNDILPAPKTPTSLPANISQDAAYEEIDSRLQLMFASPKPADKTSTISSLTVANPVKTQLLQPTLENNAVAASDTDTDVPPEIGLPVTKAPIDDAKPPADFSVTDSFLSDISATSFLTCDMNVTINETNHSGVNPNSSFSDSNVSTKHISLGSSDYRFEKVSENVVNLFITRKRRGKRKSTAAITTNTVPAT